jgi:hypothetical protein
MYRTFYGIQREADTKRLSLTNSTAGPQQFDQIRMRQYLCKFDPHESGANLQHLSTDRPWLRDEPPCLPCEPSQLPAFPSTQIRIRLLNFDPDPDPPACQTGRESMRIRMRNTALKDPRAKKEIFKKSNMLTEFWFREGGIRMERYEMERLKREGVNRLIFVYA